VAKDKGWKYLSQSSRASMQIPKESGIYAFELWDIINHTKKVVYVGKSQNLSIRLKPWHIVERKAKTDLGEFLVCKYFLTDDYHKKEVEYIKRFRPKYNIVCNPDIKRKIVYLNG
jgi:excinuclease UvrABC nuclease subunit